MRTALLGLAAALSAAGPAGARTLTVGPGQEFPGPAAAIRSAVDGDTVLIEPGQYFECAVTDRNHLTIEGHGTGVVLTDATCEGKAVLVLRGEGDTVRNLTLARARVHDGNGAGIRLEVGNLLVERVRFENDQVGILAGSVGGELRVLDCAFADGGVGGEDPKYAVLVGAVARLSVERSTFAGVKGGQISSAADRTELIGNQIGTGTGEQSGEAVVATRGALLMQDNVITAGPNPPRRNTAVLAWDEATVTMKRNRLVNQTGQALVLLRDWTGSAPVLEGNQVGPGDTERATGGIVRHRASSFFYEKKNETHALAGQMKRFVRHYLLGREDPW